MNNKDQLDSNSFNKNYQILKDTADELAADNDPDIDALIPKVQKAMEAYEICKTRLDAAQEALGKYLPREKASSGTADSENGEQLGDDPESDTSSPNVANGIAGSGESIPF